MMLRSSSSRAFSSTTAVLFAAVRALDRSDNWRVGAGAVERLLYGQHAVVVRGSLDEIDDRGE